MLKSLHIRNFRGFRDLKIESLKRVNLIVGQNDTGKTCILEALALLLSAPYSSKINLPNLFRVSGGDWNENFWKWLFHKKSVAKNAEIHAGLDNQKEFEIIVQPSPEIPINHDSARLHRNEPIGNFPCYTVGSKSGPGHKPAIFSTHPSDPIKDAVDYNRVILKRRKRDVESMLKKIEPRLEAVEALQIGQPNQSTSPLIYADIGLSEMIPVTQLGQGFNRLLDIYSEIVSEDAKVLLIDEVENGLHYSVLSTIWEGLFLAAKEFDVQIFATTHSWECILAADQAAREQPEYDLAVIRLDRVKDDTKATVIDERSMSTAKELQWEMR